MSTKNDLVQELAEIGLTNEEAKSYVESLLDEIKGQLSKDNDVQITNFGKFECRQRKGRTMKNPKTGEKHEIDDYFVVHFNASENFKDQFEDETHGS
ncbi:MAG: HU family DNA-binding protein [bacterium]